MATTRPIQADSFTVFSVVDKENKTSEVKLKTDQKNITINSSFVEQPAIISNTGKIETDDLIVKWVTEKDNSDLKAISIYSKHANHIRLTVEFQNRQLLTDSVHEKYQTVINAVDTAHNKCDRIYALLLESPTDFPMIPAEQVKKVVGGFLRGKPTPEGLVDLRHEIMMLKNMPYRCELG